MGRMAAASLQTTELQNYQTLYINRQSIYNISINTTALKTQKKKIMSHNFEGKKCIVQKDEPKVRKRRSLELSGLRLSGHGTNSMPL